MTLSKKVSTNLVEKLAKRGTIKQIEAANKIQVQILKIQIIVWHRSRNQELFRFKTNKFLVILMPMGVICQVEIRISTALTKIQQMVGQLKGKRKMK